ncbi:hypothetical protein ACFVT5_20805 [Streptomyces sp. NPDC058001]|uniref:hypothetical protein n=1 Tax=Streptomyces sp. NPDC058001 TaxID=3346300 RepID=UPI0036EB4875
MRNHANSSGKGTGRRGLRALVLLVGICAVAALVGHYLGRGRPAPAPPAVGCAVPGGRGAPPVPLSLEQAEHAATISATARSRRLPERAVTIALATAYQESGLENLDYGDRDSLGLFQQRPSQGWGTAKQVQDPVYAANKFYDKLVKVSGYERMPLTVAAQEVQRSGFPDAYAQHEDASAALASALGGGKGAALNCTVRAGDPPASAKAGRTAVADAVRTGFGKGPVATAPAPGQALAYRVPDARTGWALAQWLVTRAATLPIASVSYADRSWAADGSDRGWHKPEPGGTDGGSADGADAKGGGERVTVTLVAAESNPSESKP